MISINSEVFAENKLTDRTGEVRLVSPDYKKNTVIMRYDLRKSGYFEEPYIETALESIDGQLLHCDLLDIFNISRQKREANVLNAYRYSDFCQGYNAKSKIAILANEKESVTSEQDTRTQIHIMIELLEDNLETQSVIRDLFDKIKDKKDIEVLSQFLNCLIEKDYQTLFDNI